MAKIHGITYIIIGIAVILMSWFSNARSDSNSMTLFIYVGIIFVIIGIIKIFILFIKKQNEPKTHHSVEHHSQQHHQIHQVHQKVKSQTFPGHITCPSCHARNAAHSNFCMRCGYMFRKT